MNISYFAYGSNMDPARMRDREIHFETASSACLRDMALALNQPTSRKTGAGRASFHYAKGGVVEGVLYQLVDEHAILTLDRFEGTPRSYSREIFYVETKTGLLPAWAYVGNSRNQSNDLKPERWYLDHMLSARSYLSTSYWQGLAAIEALP